MNEGMADLTQIEAMGLAGSAIRSIADGNLKSARADLRTAVAELDELIEWTDDEKDDALFRWAENAAGTPSED